MVVHICTLELPILGGQRGRRSMSLKPAYKEFEIEVTQCYKEIRVWEWGLGEI